MARRNDPVDVIFGIIKIAIAIAVGIIIHTLASLI